MAETPIYDVFAAVVPEEIDPIDLDQRAALIKMLDAIAWAYVLRQWSNIEQRPTAITDMVSAWAIIHKVEDVEQFQPVHDCAACRAGNDQARAFLRDNPNRWVALANLTYIEVWDD